MGSLSIGRGKEALLTAAHALPPVGIRAVKHLDLISLVEAQLTRLLRGVSGVRGEGYGVWGRGEVIWV